MTGVTPQTTVPSKPVLRSMRETGGNDAARVSIEQGALMKVLRSTNLLRASAEELAAIGIEVVRGALGLIRVERSADGRLLAHVGNLDISPGHVRAIPCLDATERDEAILFGEAARMLWSSPGSNDEPSVAVRWVWRVAHPWEMPGAVCPGIRRLYVSDGPSV